MHNDTGSSDLAFSGLNVGAAFGPVVYDVSETANDRYWQGAGVEHPTREAGFLYPPMAANLTILALQSIAPTPLLHTHQRLDCHRAMRAPTALTETGTVTGRFARRGREYLEVTADISADDTSLWTSVASFIAAGTTA